MEGDFRFEGLSDEQEGTFLEQIALLPFEAVDLSTGSIKDIEFLAKVSPSSTPDDLIFVVQPKNTEVDYTGGPFNKARLLYACKEYISVIQESDFNVCLYFRPDTETI